jgi:protein arginine kinase
LNFNELASNAARWLSGEEDSDGMVISCRARLARNISAVPFAPKATVDDQELVIDRVLSAAQRSRHMRHAAFFKMNALQANERRLLVERHLVSPALAESKGQRGVLFSSDESLSIMINEEDHLRLQAILPGLKSAAAWSAVNALDDELGAALEYAHSDDWGFLTACPTNVGTGLRISVLIHLPALVLTEDMERVTRGLTQMTFTVRGFYGEGTNSVGNLFQISNQSTLGVEEGQIVEKLTTITRQIIAHEKDAQEALLKEAPAQVEDKVWRAYGLLAHARVLSSQEFMNLLSAVRLGRSLGLIEQVDSGFMNRLMIITQPSHLQTERGSELTPEERDMYRAELVRSHFAQLCAGNTGAS